MPPKSLEIDGLNVFTLNCWGLRYVSDHRQVRIKLIAQHLVDQDYDVVFLQEVWIQSDFEYIRTKTNFKYKFAHMFNNASLLGTSGLVILAKWTPELIHFQPYSINGSPFRPFHGDWFSTKGAAYVRIELLGLNLHLFCTHMHAQYDINEKIVDQYSVHRICQAYELGKFINLMSCNCTNTGSKDLIILAGDMNTSSKELPYRLLIELTDLNDCYKMLQYEAAQQKHQTFRNKKINNIKRIQKLKIQELLDQESSDEELTTCGHRENTFTPQQNLRPDQKAGKRIDFIFYKLRDSLSSSAESRSNKLNDAMNLLKNNSESIFNDTNNHKIEMTPLLFCFPEKVTVVAKDVSGLSFSDHQPVVAKLHFSWKTFQEIVNEEKKDNSTVQDEDDSCNETENKSCKINDIKCNVMSKLGTKLKRKFPSDEYSKQISGCINQPLCKRWKDSTLIQEIEDLLTTYINKFKPSFKYSLFIILFMVFTFIFLLIILKFLINLTFTETFLMAIIFFIITTIGLLLKFITHRTEINAIKAILNDIHKKKTFYPDYGLTDVQ